MNFFISVICCINKNDEVDISNSTSNSCMNLLSAAARVGPLSCGCRGEGQGSSHSAESCQNQQVQPSKRETHSGPQCKKSHIHCLYNLKANHKATVKQDDIVFHKNGSLYDQFSMINKTVYLSRMIEFYMFCSHFEEPDSIYMYLYIYIWNF